MVLENERVRVLDFQLKKGAKEDFHAHPAAVTYVQSPFKIRFTFPDGSTRVREAKAGEVFYGDALTHALRGGALRKRWKNTKRLRISRHPLSAQQQELDD